MKVNMFNPEWSELEKERFFSILTEKKPTPENMFKIYLHLNKQLFFSACGKSSLYAILKSNNIGRNDEVLLPCYCCESVAYPIRYLHAKPILSDIDISDLNISAGSILELITNRTKAIIVPSLYGNPANIIEIKEMAGKNIIVINDLAQGYGATLNNSPIECFGDAGFISCGPGKQLTGAGGSIYWLNNLIELQSLKKQNASLNRIFHELFYYIRVNIDETIKQPFYNIASFFYMILNHNTFRTDKLATNLDINVMLMLMENYQDKLEKKRGFIREVEQISENKSYRLIMEHRGKSSPVKIVLLFNSIKSCNAAKKILERSSVYYSVGYKKINGIEKINLYGYNQVSGKIIEIPLEIGKKEYILEVIRKIS